MMRLLRLESLLICFIFFVGTLSGQVNDIRFRQISPPGGFALKGIYSITQDELGYIWIGTRQGLIRYSSRNAKWFIPSPNDSLSIPSEIVNDIHVDESNKIWIATNSGLCAFDRQKQGFRPIEYTYEDGSKRADIVRSTLKLESGEILLLDESYIGYLDVENRQLRRIGIDQIKFPTKIYQDNQRRIWIGTRNGEIYQFFPSQNEVKKVVQPNGVQVNTIYADADQLWVGFRAGGANLYRLNGERLKNYTLNDSGGENPLSGNVRVIKKDTYGRLWFGAYEGLFMDDGKEIVHFDPNKYPGLSHNSIFEIFEDRQGGIWVGTWSGGVSLIHHSDNLFRTYRHNTLGNSISNNTVSSFLQVSSDELLIGTEVGGLNSFNLSTGRFKELPLSKGFSVKNIKSLRRDKEGGIWVGTFKKGLWYRSEGSQNFKLFEQGPEDGYHLSSSSVYSMCAVDSGVWLATYPFGINFYDYRSKTIRYYTPEPHNEVNMFGYNIQCVLADSDSNLWLGSQHGLFKVHLPSGNIEKVGQTNSALNLDDKTIFYIFEHSSGSIWIGTKNNGVVVFDPESGHFEAFDADGLLEGKDVYGIIEGQNKKIWITSNNGLILFNPENKSSHHFVYSDGIQSNLFCPQSVYQDAKQNLYFGGTNGFTTFNPAEVRMNSKAPFTIINELVKRDNQQIVPVYHDNNEIEKITLNPGETTFRINFSADNYLMSEKNRYKYRLVNYYDEWVETTSEGSVLFKSIKPGEYVFEVKACNNDGIWSDQPTRLPLEIKNYWYRTNLAYLVYVFLFLTLLYFIGRFYTERIKLKRAILLEKNQRENDEQIHEMKLKFFTNISHEFRTPLALIAWPLKRLINAENITEEQREELEVVNRNSGRLLQLINQILDLRKLEKGKSELTISKVEVNRFIEDIQKGFLSEAKSKGVNFICELPCSSLEIEADREKLDAIIYNLLSNAYKYVSEKGEIKVYAGHKRTNDATSFTNQLSFGEIGSDNFIEISVEDTGSGIDSEDLVTIFNRFERGKQTDKIESSGTKGSGIGLSLCKEYTLLHHGKIIAQTAVGKGSRFTLLLPTRQKAQKILFESHQEYRHLKNTEPLSLKHMKEREPAISSKVLVVEDNQDLRKFIGKYLYQYYEVDFATNGEEALTILKKQSFDLIISDVMMPKMDGFEFCSIVKTQLETSHIPVILLTALSSSENLIAGLDKGADAYLTKPFDEAILLKQIENILEQRRRIRENFSQQFVSQKTVELGSLDNFFLNRVRSVVEKNLTNDNFGMEMLAEEMMISRSQLHRKIKSLSGSSTSEFVNLVRVKKAVELINTGNYLLNEVAFLVGFGSQSYFTKCFKKVYNKTPKEFFAQQESRYQEV